jgi:hypothetical protein
VDSKTIRTLIGGILIGGIRKNADSIRRKRKFKRPLREWDGLI